MPIQITYSDKGVGSIVTGSGKVTEKEYLDFYRKYLSQDGATLHKHRYNLTDWLEVTMVDISAEAISEIAILSKRAAEIDPGCVTAIVASEDFIYGLSRMWEIQSSDTESTVMVFRERAEAEAWIRQQVEARYGITNLTFD